MNLKKTPPKGGVFGFEELLLLGAAKTNYIG